MADTVTIRCEACGYTLSAYPVKGRSLPKRCPRCGAANSFREK